MTGWSYKEITSDDLKFPVVYGEGKRSRLLATIGQLSIFCKQNVVKNEDMPGLCATCALLKIPKICLIILLVP